MWAETVGYLNMTEEVVGANAAQRRYGPEAATAGDDRGRGRAAHIAGGRSPGRWKTRFELHDYAG